MQSILRFIGMIFQAVASFFRTILEHTIFPFYRTGSKGSFGRLWSSILLFCILFKYWMLPTTPRDPPESMVTILKMMISYVFLTKGIDMLKEKILDKLIDHIPFFSKKAPVEVPKTKRAATPKAKA